MAPLVIPAFASAMQDRTLRGNPREAYIWCHENLDIVTYRAVKHSEIELSLGMTGSRVSDAIARLVERGYLARGDRDGRLQTYRLVYSRPLPTVPTLIPSKPE